MSNPKRKFIQLLKLKWEVFFVELWKQYQVGSIIETHSDNILLRFRRLIVKGELSPGDISVAFFDIEKGKPVIQNLDLNEDGSMEEGLPMEFFGGNILEGLKLGAGK